VGTFKARDSVFAASGGGAVDAMTLSRGTGLLSASLVGDTAVAAGSTATAALTANGGLVSAVNTLLRATGGSGQHDIVAAGANVTADHSSFTTTQATLGGQVPNPAAGGNVAGDPGLVSPAAPDSGLQAASPLHDRGDPAAVTAGETDREGYMRALDYDCDGVAQPDIGAFESPAPSVCPSAPPGSDPSPPGAGAGGSVPGAGGSVPGAGGPGPVPGGLDTIPPKLTRVALAHRGFTARRGTQLRFTLSEPARLRIAMTRIAGHKRRPAGTVAVAQQAAGRHHVRLMGRIGRRSLGPGRYRARIVAIDAAGNRSAPVSLGFTIAAK
jgi:hypothetical protein